MSLDELNKLKNRIHKKDELGSIDVLMDFIRETGSLGDVIGRDYEVKNLNDEVIFKIHLKPISTVKLNTLLKSLNYLRKKEQEANKKKGRR